MPWMLPAAMVASTAIGAGASLLGGNNQDLPSLPPFQKDPLVETSENSMFNFGSDVLKGILPSSYQNLLQFDSPQFESVLHNSNRDVQTAGLETAARTGNIRSGAAQAGISQATANNSANMRYADYMNTLTNQKGLLNFGLDAENRGGNLALGNQGQMNNYALGGYSAMLGATVNMTGLSQNAQAATGKAIGSGIGDIASILPYLGGGQANPGSAVTANAGTASSITGALGSQGNGIDDLLAQYGMKR